MGHFRIPRTPRVGWVATGVVALMAVASPAGASGTPSVPGAEAAVNAARAHAHAADTALSVIERGLAAATAHAHAIAVQADAARRSVAADQETVDRLQAQIRTDRLTLADFVRQSYKQGPNAGLAYVLAGGSVTDILQRTVDEQRVRDQGNVLVVDVERAQAAANAALDDARAASGRLAVLEQQAVTAAALVAVDEENAALAAQAAHAGLSQSVAALHQAEALAAAAAPPPPPPVPPTQGQGGIIYSPVSQATFTEDTDLTLASGMTVKEINDFLSGTALAGLGASYVTAEQTYHVSARYLVAHSILESGWGTSAIAQDKHNLFGFGADDSNPYGDAMTFTSFDACIQYVAHFVATHYLSTSGVYYHGPTLRGMNVDYASDPLWASKIARIADTIP